ncbi:MAG: hypothetical protein ACE5NN_00485 [Candidatus Bathyarchaeia archaeon]
MPIAVFAGIFKNAKITETSMLSSLIMEPRKPLKRIIRIKKVQM